MSKRPLLFRAAGVLAATLMAVATLPQADARTEIVKLRQTRQAKADERWSAPEKVTINVHYRVPVVETLGYLAAFYPDNQKLVAISDRLRPVAAQVSELAGESFQGRAFPPEVQQQCDLLRQELFKAVNDIYGAEAVARIEHYLDQKYKMLTSGLFNAIEG